MLWDRWLANSLEFQNMPHQTVQETSATYAGFQEIAGPTPWHPCEPLNVKPEVDLWRFCVKRDSTAARRTGPAGKKSA